MKVLECPNAVLCYIYIYVGVYNVTQLLRKLRTLAEKLRAEILEMKKSVIEEIWIHSHF